jgi:hypothetical protein
MYKMLIAAMLFLTLLGGCKKSDTGPTGPSTPSTEDWSFPANSTKFSVTLYAPKQTVAVGETFEVRAVCYNVSSLFGAAVEIACQNGKAQVTQVISGPFFAPDSVLIGVAANDTTANLASYGVTFKAGSGKVTNGSGALFKLRCKARVAGAAAFVINTSKLQLLKSDGTPIPNFGTLQVENSTVTVQ